MGFDFAAMIYRIPALLFAISIHEYAHAQCADSLGDPTGRYLGRLTLNPLAHIDTLGAILLIFTGFGWAKPVPFDPGYFKDRKAGIAKVALAGPAGNLFLCFLAALLMAILQHFGLLSLTVRRFLWSIEVYNVWFAFFNLIPIPPLDGSHVLCQLLPFGMAWDYQAKVGRYGFYILIALVFLGVTNMVIVPLSNLYLNLINGIIHIIL